MVSPFDLSIPIRIVGIDNGTNRLGIAVVDLDVLSEKVTLLETRTVLSDDELSGQCRYLDIQRRVIDFVETVSPNYVFIESPYVDRKNFRPHAFAALTEMLTLLRYGLFISDTAVPVALVPPQRAKSAIGCLTNQKESVRPALELLVQQDRLIVDALPDSADALDAVAIAIAGARQFIDNPIRGL